MTKIAFMSAKGGVGKTALSVAVASATAAEGRTVALVDTDPQISGSATPWLRRVENTTLMPPTLSYWDAGSTEAAVSGLPSLDADHDFVILDTPPRLDEVSLRTIASLVDLVVVPTTTSDQDMEAAMQTIVSIRTKNKPVIVITQAPPSAMHDAHALQTQLRERGFRVANTITRSLVAARRAYRFGVLPHQVPDQNAVSDVINLTTEILTAAAN